MGVMSDGLLLLVKYRFLLMEYPEIVVRFLKQVP